jgi:hypothetical protein
MGKAWEEMIEGLAEAVKGLEKANDAANKKEVPMEIWKQVNELYSMTTRLLNSARAFR